MRRLVSEVLRRPHGWTAMLLVSLSLLGGLRAGDTQAGHATLLSARMTDELRAEQVRLDVVRAAALDADQVADSAQRRVARAALAALLAGTAQASDLLPRGMRFACADRAAGQCAVVAESGRTTSLVWPTTRPRWGLPIGLPPGTCDLWRGDLAASRPDTCR